MEIMLSFTTLTFIANCHKRVDYIKLWFTLQAQKIFGNRWTEIAKVVSGRLVNYKPSLSKNVSVFTVNNEITNTKDHSGRTMLSKINSPLCARRVRKTKHWKRRTVPTT